MSTEHTETNFTGIDISAVWPTEIRPRNCRFQVVNAVQGLPFEDNTFDFVYQRFMVLAYTARDWPFVIQELVRVTKPGGIIELTEMPIMSNANGPEMNKILEILERGFTAKGLKPRIVKKLNGFLMDAGLEHVETHRESIPVGAWGAKVGQLMRENFAGIWSSLKGWIKELTGMTDAQYDAMIKRIFVEYETHKCYVNCYCAWGVKPYPKEQLARRASSSQPASPLPRPTGE
ncbi:S-adenosyl-L-methionine-dependent methyltransferase [Dissophora ornata]|nr:S-adenosyl-L-methionine-dependent methyltransferase [Dissophora ornata]